jgi:molybdate transport system regulatory protein
MDKPIFKLNGRVWIETTNGKVLGLGRVELLERIQASGSIRQAALQMKMSYKQAWDMINQMNAEFNIPLVISQRGGKGGGNAIITAAGLSAIEQFHALQKKFLEFLSITSKEINL